MRFASSATLPSPLGGGAGGEGTPSGLPNAGSLTPALSRREREQPRHEHSRLVWILCERTP